MDDTLQAIDKARQEVLAGIVPQFPARKPVPLPLPGVLRYVVLDKDNALVFESDDVGEALSHMGAGGGVAMCDRNFKVRAYTTCVRKFRSLDGLHAAAEAERK